MMFVEGNCITTPMTTCMQYRSQAVAAAAGLGTQHIALVQWWGRCHPPSGPPSPIKAWQQLGHRQQGQPRESSVTDFLLHQCPFTTIIIATNQFTPVVRGGENARLAAFSFYYFWSQPTSVRGSSHRFFVCDGCRRRPRPRFPKCYSDVSPHWRRSVPLVWHAAGQEWDGAGGIDFPYAEMGYHIRYRTGTLVKDAFVCTFSGIFLIFSSFPALAEKKISSHAHSKCARRLESVFDAGQSWKGTAYLLGRNWDKNLKAP